MRTQKTGILIATIDSLQVGLAYATTLDSDNTVQDFCPLGGFLRLSGLERAPVANTGQTKPQSGRTRLDWWRMALVRIDYMRGSADGP